MVFKIKTPEKLINTVHKCIIQQHGMKYYLQIIQ